MTSVAYRNHSNGHDKPFIPYEVQEFISAEIHRQCSPQRAAKLLPVCFDAIECYVRGDLLAVLPLPEGCSNDGSVTASVWLLIEELGLGIFADEVRLANGLPIDDAVPLSELVPDNFAIR